MQTFQQFLIAAQTILWTINIRLFLELDFLIVKN